MAKAKAYKPRSKRRIWDKGVLVPAFTRKPKDPRARELSPRTIDEKKRGIKYYIPASALAKKAK